MEHTKRILLAIVPAVAMIWLIAIIPDDRILAGLFVLIIAASFAVRYDRHDLLFALAGLLLFPIAEYLFVSTGVETFARHTLLGVMPLWLPLQWAWGAVAIKRVVMELDQLFARSRIW